MSYILEALKKSEKKRQGKQQNLTHLATEETPEQERPPTRRPLWPLLLGLALVINAGIMLIIFWPFASNPPAPPALDSANQHAQETSRSAVRVAASEPQRAASPPSAKAQRTKAIPSVPDVQVNQREAAPPIAARVETQPQIQSAPAAATTTVTPKRVAQGATNIQEEIADEANTRPARADIAAQTRAPRPDAVAKPAPVRFNDLPLEYRRQLPEMHMSVHAYSEEPSAAVIRINNKMLRPGGYLEGGVRLEEITREGAIFSFAGRRFLLPRR